MENRNMTDFRCGKCREIIDIGAMYWRVDDIAYCINCIDEAEAEEE